MAKALSKTTFPYPNLTTKSETITFRLNENTLKSIDGYANVLDMNRSGVIEVMLHFAFRYMALKNLEKRSENR